MDPVGEPGNSLVDAPAGARIARGLATPIGVLVIVPLLVITAGVVVMLLGRRATRDASDSMARQQLAAQAKDVQHEVAFALDQADALLVRMRVLATPALSIEEVAPRLHDLHVARPGVANLSIGFPDGSLRGTFGDPNTGEVRVQESRIGAQGTTRRNYRIAGGRAEQIDETTTDYDVRTRPQYVLALAKRARVWGAPRTYFTSHTTGVTCAEPVFATDGSLVGVLDVAFDVGALSAFIVRPPLAGARTVVFTRDGTVLAFPGTPVPEIAIEENRVLHHEDYRDPALEAMFAEIGTLPADQRFLQLHATDGDYLASIAPVGGRRANAVAPLDWYLATLVPEATLLGPTKRLEKQSLVASAGALAVALGVALMFAWNLVRMRRAVGVARAQARSAEARAKQLGSYRLVAKLGAGGMGEVWRAEHRLLAREAAIKLARPEALRDPIRADKVRERFKREAQTLASMRSRHTIALYDYGVTDDGTLFFVMELLDGLDLDKLVRAHGPLPAARVVHLLVQACQSLAEAHDAKLLHRDIKPANLFVCRAADEVDVIKVLDFGIVRMLGETADPMEVVALPTPDAPAARPSQRLTHHGAFVGTPGYVAPEQAIGGSIDPRADLYALACVAWWLLTASEVFPRSDEDRAIASHANDPVPSLRDRMTGWLPDQLASIIEACLAKRPEQRPDDARALARMLRAIPIPAEHAWTDELAQAWWRTHRTPKDQAEIETRSIERLVVPDIDASRTHHDAIGVEAKTIEQRPGRIGGP